jgi:hypothetical protein
MKNKEKQLEKLIRLNKITESLFTAIQYIYLNDLDADDLDVARLKNVTNELFCKKIDKLREQKF